MCSRKRGVVPREVVHHLDRVRLTIPDDLETDGSLVFGCVRTKHMDTCRRRVEACGREPAHQSRGFQKCRFHRSVPFTPLREIRRAKRTTGEKLTKPTEAVDSCREN